MELFKYTLRLTKIMIEYTYTIKIGIAFIILIIGFLVMRLLSRIMIKLRRISGVKPSLEKPFTTIFDKIFYAIILIATITYMGFSSGAEFAYKFLELFPSLFLLVLIIILGVLMVNIITWLFEKLIIYSKLEQIVNNDINKNLIPLIFILIKIVLYLILIDVAIRIVNVPALEMVSSYLIIPVISIVFLMILITVFNPLMDFSSGFYLKNIWPLDTGGRIKLNNEIYTIKNIFWLYIQLESKNGNLLVLPNRKIVAQGIELIKPAQDLLTLEELKKKYVAQMPSMCGPASAQMALSIFNIQSDQKEIANLSGSVIRKSSGQVAGTHPKKIIEAVEKLTNNKVKGSWIDYDKIYNLGLETAKWLEEGALLIVDYKKKYLFPSAISAHYSLVVGINQDELLIIDPSSKKGGVYFVDYRDIEIGMNTYSELIMGKRGYIVLAPEATLAYERINEGLIYHHISMYTQISKNLSQKLNKLTSTPALIDMLPQFVKKHLKSYENEQVSRLWKP
ncbi:MAG: C39 family peptidase [Candidatus Woesearchaeota archaeon]